MTANVSFTKATKQTPQQLPDSAQAHFADWVFGKGSVHIPNVSDVPGAEDITGVEYYSTRIIPVLSASQYLLVSDTIVPASRELAAYQRDYAKSDFADDHIIGVEPKPNVALTETILNSPNTLKKIHDISGEYIQPFYVSERAGRIAAKTGKSLPMTENIAYLLNDKYKARCLFEENGFKTPGARLIERQQGDMLQQATVIVKQLRQAGHQGSFAASRPQSCRGLGVHRFIDLDDLAELLNTELQHDDRLIIEPWLDNVIASPSIQVMIGNNARSDIVIGITDQLLNGTAHVGNIHPSQLIQIDSFKKILRSIISCLRKAGARGILGVDLIVTRDPKTSKRDIYAIEINARQTGAIYGGLLAMRLRGEVGAPWLTHNNISVNSDYDLNRYIQYLERTGIHYTPGKDEGVIITSNGGFQHGQAMVLCLAPSKERLEELLAQANNAHT